MSKAGERLLALGFGLACSSLIGLVAWAWLRTPVHVDPAAIQKGPPTRLAGRVHDGDHMIAGALIDVGVTGPDTANPLSQQVELTSAGSANPGQFVESDAEGRFEATVACSGALSLQAVPPGGGLPVIVSLDLGSGGDRTVDVAFGGPRIIGRVVDRVTRGPVVGAQLSLQDSKWPIVATSDRSGGFWLAGVAPGDRTLLVRHPGHVGRLVHPVSVRPDTDVTDFEVELDPESIIEGELLDGSGRPLLDPRGVVVFRDDHSPQPSGQPALYAESSGGHFRIGGVAAGRQRIGVKPPIMFDVSWTLQTALSGMLFDQLVDVGVGETVKVSLQESIPISLPASPKH